MIYKKFDKFYEFCKYVFCEGDVQLVKKRIAVVREDHEEEASKIDKEIR